MSKKEQMRVPASGAGDKSDFKPEPISDDESHIAVCIGVFYLGFQEGSYSGKAYEREEIIIQWEVDEKYSKEAGEYAGKRKKISKRYTFSYANKANLYKLLCSWFGTSYIDKKKQEMVKNPAALNIYNLLGAACLMSVFHQEKDDRIYARVDAVQKLPKTMKAFKPSELIQDDSPEVPEWIQKIKDEAVEAELESKKVIEETDDDEEDDDPLGGGNTKTILEDDDLE